jgi:hypothetical protein
MRFFLIVPLSLAVLAGDIALSLAIAGWAIILTETANTAQGGCG